LILTPRAIPAIGARVTVITCPTVRDLTRSLERGIWAPHLEEEVSSMCYERYLRRRREADESHEMWHDFERTRPVVDPDGPPQVTEPERTEAQEEIAVAER
jgi:hypothetical protein